MSILVFLNGSVVQESSFFKEAEEIIAVDGGFDKIHPSLKDKKTKIIGDLDSIGSNPEGFDVLKFPKEKDKSDFELTLQYISENYKQKKVVVYGLTGGRIDHQLFNFFVLKDHLAINQFIGESEIETIYFSQGDITIDVVQGQTFSIFPLEPLSGLTIKGGYYPLVGQDVNLNDSLTLSNKAMGSSINVSTKTGAFALILVKNTYI